MLKLLHLSFANLYFDINFGNDLANMTEIEGCENESRITDLLPIPIEDPLEILASNFCFINYTCSVSQLLVTCFCGHALIVLVIHIMAIWKGSFMIAPLYRIFGDVYNKFRSFPSYMFRDETAY